MRIDYQTLALLHLQCGSIFLGAAALLLEEESINGHPNIKRFIQPADIIPPCHPSLHRPHRILPCLRHSPHAQHPLPPRHPRHPIWLRQRPNYVISIRPWRRCNRIVSPRGTTTTLIRRSRNNNDNDNNDDTPRKGPSSSRALLFHNPQLLSRYKSARYEYLRQRTMDTFVSEVLPTFCDDRGSFALPEAISEEE